jgi:hypothetical protein
LGLVIITVAVVASAFVAVNVHLDPMGLFHSKAHLLLYTNERWSKYLLTLRYVPEHFDAVLVGSSLTDNWDTGLMQPQTYNLSLEGGDISEERLLLENVLKQRAPKIVFFCVHPYLTASNGRKTPYMTRSDYWSALGSIELLKTYHGRQRVEQRAARQEFNEFGRRLFQIPSRPWRPRTMAKGDSFEVDERSLAEYAKLVASARAAGARVVAVIPPVNREEWLTTEGAYRQYQRRILSFFRSDELLIDFNTPPYDALRGDRRNFPDGGHLSDSAAPFFAQELSRLIRN